MNEEDRLKDIIVTVVKAAASPLWTRLRAVEARAAVPGPQGLPGPSGTPGTDGAAGRDGVFDAASLASIEAHVCSRIDGLVGSATATLGMLDERINRLDTSVHDMEVQRAGAQLDPAEIAATCEGLLRSALASTRRPSGRRQRGLHV